jgi:prepilin-type N-terminal cleavage/methylation domain-containing protein
MDKRKAFTLIELLVVISIIALLMAIMMPALSKVRESAKKTICKTYVRQWGMIFALYAQDNNNRLIHGYIPNNKQFSQRWFDSLSDYYQNDELYLCPSATKPVSEVGSYGSRTAWEYDRAAGSQGQGPYDDEMHVVGSYGRNFFAGNPPEKLYQPTWHWRTMDVRKANNIPLVFDAFNMMVSPYHRHLPPEQEGLLNTNWSPVCISRHNAKNNMVFLDLSVREVGLKDLWTFNWSKRFDVSYPEPEWPDWIERLDP